MSFSSDLKRFNRNVEKKAEKIVRGTAFGIFKSVIERTPVKTGRAKGNWQADINKPATGEIDRTDTSPIRAIGPEMKAAMKVVTEGAKLGDSIFLVNNLPYINRLEDGSSKQMPSGMVKVTVTEFEREVNRQASKLK